MVVISSPAGGRDAVGCEQFKESPMARLATLGTGSFEEPVERHSAEHYSCQAEESRQERQDHGHVLFRTESHVFDIGGLGWRTKSGQMVKNQGYFTQLSKVNDWDKPTHAGKNSWKEWHGPRLRADAPMMAKLDDFDQAQEEWGAKKTFVNTMRIQTLDRFYNQKTGRSQLEASASWAPHRRARREVHDAHERFSADLDALPEKELRKVCTEKVLQRDRQAVRDISKRVQTEETWKMAWKHMEQERRFDILADFQQRQLNTDILMQMSGQPVRQRKEASEHYIPENSSTRTVELAQHREPAAFQDVTQLTDFRGLIHADNPHALEALMPGFGHELSVEFKARVTESTKGGWPPPPRPSTPARPSKKQSSRESELQRSSSLTRGSVPASKPRLHGIAARYSDESLMAHSKAQFLATSAPPPPDQKKTLLKEDWKGSTTLQDPTRVTGTFERTDQGSVPTSPVRDGHPNQLHIPPPLRQYAYPVLAPASPAARSTQLSSHADALSTTSNQTNLKRNDSAPASLFRGGLESRGSRAMRGRGRSSGMEPPAVQTLCQELDAFEASVQPLPRISNFFGAPVSQKDAERLSGSASGLVLPPRTAP
eukprot:gnl/TRDRNA2_/TRDRNA2_49105_c0_seq1.p1 gnl/TRDRNA2_/TRDRNA2_49105_c0~~gnl/TRDRNA2_/TRDRNA2_49105_c0_seq1.p1  ORF type:complete len:599 (+),score=114.05 gnl/TRDRNA2_/TRDRNA2_49105_c0_seq1:122-1918(+)